VTHRVLLGTRKGLIDYRLDPSGWRLHRLHFPADPVTAILDHQGVLLAALNTGHFGAKLFRSTDDGENWTEIPTPAYPPQPEPDLKPAWKLIQIWTLDAGPDGTFWAGTLPGGLFRSTDQGLTWQIVDSLWNHPQRPQWNGGGYDTPGIHSLCFDPKRPGFLAAAVSTGGVWHSDDSGNSWRQIATGLKARYMPPDLQLDPISQDPHRIVQCPAAPGRFWCQHHSGVFQSYDFGETWHEPTQSPFGFAVAVHPQDPNTAWFVPAVADQRRLPPGESLHVLRTRDGGQSFEELRAGLPQRDCFDLVYRHCLEIDPSGQLLGFGTTTGNFYASQDQGNSWRLVNAHLPPVYSIRVH
jgi:photosystem II stability/assembly factor-like uncharacterized protein